MAARVTAGPDLVQGRKEEGEEFAFFGLEVCQPALPLAASRLY